MIKKIISIISPRSSTPAAQSPRQVQDSRLVVYLATVAQSVQKLAERIEREGPTESSRREFAALKTELENIERILKS